MRVGLVQLNGSDDPVANLAQTTDLITKAAHDGAAFVLTPEVTNIIGANRAQQNAVLAVEADDETLTSLRLLASKLDIWILIGSLALKTDDADGRFANRSILIDPHGAIRARYDKIHMFDVQVNDAECYQESKSFRPGNVTSVVEMGAFNLGMSICYDIRFPHLYRDLALAGANMIAVPAAMSPITGPAHIEVLLRARAIETGCYMLMPSQTGDHGGRVTWGHSMVVSPWGEVLVDMGTDAGFRCLDLDIDAVKEARMKIPSLYNNQPYQSPKNV
jgi:predicted amidohydrolase